MVSRLLREVVDKKMVSQIIGGVLQAFYGR
jgi:hypothetical protein